MFPDHEEVIECITLGGFFFPLLFFWRVGGGKEIFMGMRDGLLTLFEV